MTRLNVGPDTEGVRLDVFLSEAEEMQASNTAKERNRKMSGFEFVLVVIGAATLTSWLFKVVDIVEGR